MQSPLQRIALFNISSTDRTYIQFKTKKETNTPYHSFFVEYIITSSNKTNYPKNAKSPNFDASLSKIVNDSMSSK